MRPQRVPLRASCHSIGARDSAPLIGIRNVEDLNL